MKSATLACLTLSAALFTLAPRPSHAEENAGLKAALDECSASVSTGDNGRPDRAAMDECMTAKGFTKPIGKRGGRGGPAKEGSGDYVDKAALEAALTECKTMVSTDDSGEPNRQEVDTCMEVKGFKKPEKEARGHHGRPRGNASAGTAASDSATSSGSSRMRVRSAR
jgi:hypothetical protein